jgi:hypothetical protein
MSPMPDPVLRLDIPVVPRLDIPLRTLDRSTDSTRPDAVRRLCSPSRSLFLAGVGHREDTATR